MAEFRIEREAGAFRWRLMQGPALEIARSGRIFSTVEDARSAIEEMKRAAEAAEIATPPPPGDGAIDERSEQSFPASDPPSTWASTGGNA